MSSNLAQLQSYVEGVANEADRAITRVHQEGAKMMGRDVLTTPIQAVIKDQEDRRKALAIDGRIKERLREVSDAQSEELKRLSATLRQHTKEEQARTSVSGKVIQMMEKDPGVQMRVMSHFDGKIPRMVDELNEKLAQMEQDMRDRRVSLGEKAIWERENSGLEAQLKKLESENRTLQQRLRNAEAELAGKWKEQLGVEMATRKDLAKK